MLAIQWLRATMFVVTLLFCGAGAVKSCSCVGSATPCASYSSADAVFVGKVRTAYPGIRYKVQLADYESRNPSWTLCQAEEVVASEPEGETVEVALAHCDDKSP